MNCVLTSVFCLTLDCVICDICVFWLTFDSVIRDRCVCVLWQRLNCAYITLLQTAQQLAESAQQTDMLLNFD